MPARPRVTGRSVTMPGVKVKKTRLVQSPLARAGGGAPGRPAPAAPSAHAGETRPAAASPQVQAAIAPPPVRPPAPPPAAAPAPSGAQAATDQAGPGYGRDEAAFATARGLLPDVLPGLQDVLRGHVRQLRQALGVWQQGVRSLEQILTLVELFCDPPSYPTVSRESTTDTTADTTTGNSGAAPSAAALLPLLQTLLGRQGAGGGDLEALLAHPALASLLGRQS